MPVDVLVSPGDHLCSEFCLLFGDGGAEGITLADQVRLHHDFGDQLPPFQIIPLLVLQLGGLASLYQE